MTQRPIVLDQLCLELYAHEGGVRAYSRALLQGLLAQLPTGVRLRVFVCNDRSHHCPAGLDPRVELHACGASGRPRCWPLTPT